MTNKKKAQRKVAADKEEDEAPPAITYYHDTFHKLLPLLDQCVKHVQQNDTEGKQSGVSEWVTWTEAGLLKPKRTLLNILNVLGITKEHKSIKGAFQYILHRIPSLADYLITADTISDDSITVSVFDEPKRRSARLQQSATVPQIADKDISTQGVEKVTPRSSDNPPNIGRDDDISPDLKEFVADMGFVPDMGFHDQTRTTLSEYRKLFDEMQEKHNTMEAQISSLQASVTSHKEDIIDLKVKYETLISLTTQDNAAIKKGVRDCIAEMNTSREKCERQLREVGDTTIVQMSTWSADFSKKCQTTLNNVQDKLTTLLNEHDNVFKPFEDPRIYKYIPIDNTDPQEYSCLRNGALDKDTYLLINGLHIKVQDHVARRSQHNISSPAKKKYAPSENINSPTASNGRESMFGNTYFLGKPGGKFSNMDAYEFPPGRSHVLDVKYFIKADTNTIPEISSKASIVSHYKQYVAAAGRFGIQITPPHEVTRWGNEEYPPTCPYAPTDFDTLNQFEYIYAQSSTAIYNKLQKTIDESWQVGWNLIDQEDIHCDGYKVLYRLLEQVHPNLNNEAEIIMEPQYTTADNVFSFCKKYSQYVGYQRGMGNNISDMMAYNYVHQFLSSATNHYTEGLSECKRLYRDYMQSCDRWNDSGRISPEPVFPRLLKLDELPLTISKYSRDDDKVRVNTIRDGHIPSDWDKDDGMVHRLERRKRLDEFCKACGQFGHNVNANGECDVVAKVSTCLRWLKTAKESDLKKALKGYRDFQLKRKEDILKYSNKNNKKGKVHLASALDILTEYDLNNAFEDSQSDASSHSDDE